MYSITRYASHLVFIYFSAVPPLCPWNLRGFPISSRSVNVSWEPHPIDRGPILHYRLNITNERMEIEQHLESEPLTLIVTGLHPFTNYTISVAAFANISGCVVLGDICPVHIKTFSDGNSYRGYHTSIHNLYVSSPSSRCTSQYITAV